MQHYDSLFALLDQDPESANYYDSLPEYVREMISQRADSVNSFEGLRHYADNLLEGDI